MDVLFGQKDPEPAWGREGEILSEEAEASSSGKGHHGDMTHSTKKQKINRILCICVECKYISICCWDVQLK